MRVVLALTVAVTLCASATHAANDTPISWNGVEVITNDFSSVDRIRKVGALAPGTVLDISDPRLQTVCEAVRKELSSSKVACTSVIGGRATPDGPPTAWYVVEVDIEEREPRPCKHGYELPEDLMGLYGSWQRAFTDAIFAGEPIRERVNDRKYLDYDHAELSSFADRLHVATEGRESELEEAAGFECEPTTRMSSFYLMNFVGDPQRFVQLAGSHIDDPHAGVANAATRFLMTFADFVAPAEIPKLATQACRSLQEGGFSARNKSLMLLNAWRKSKALSFEQLAAECQQQVRNIARTSIAEQIALPARELLRR